MKFKVGDKVRVRADLVVDQFYGRFRFGSEYKHMRGKTCFITVVDPKIEIYQIDIDSDSHWWTPKMLELITNSKTKPMGRRKYILLKETDGYKKGAIFEEECDDGTQDFVLITPEHEKYKDSFSSMKPREQVTNNPKWFAEVTVFYLTKEMVKKLGKKLKI